jgi:hypothetical protein
VGFTKDASLARTGPRRPAVEAAVHQSLIGPTRVTFRRDGEEIATTRGYVA